MKRKSFKKIALLLAAIILLFGISIAHAQSLQKIAERAFASTILLVLKDSDGQSMSFGSGFFVRDKQIVTNMHVVEDASSGYVKLVNQEKKYKIVGITAFSSKYDLVLLEVSNPGDQTLPLSDNDNV
jgi:S1-C subfamily serine protease